MYMIGAYLFYIANVLWKLNLFVSLALSMLITGILGLAVERFALRPLRVKGLPKFTALICTIGVSTMLQNAMLFIMGSQSRSYPTLFPGKYVVVAGAYITYLQILIVIIAIVLLALLNTFIKKSKIGTAMRATAANYEAAELMGISTNMIVGLTFFIGSAFAAISGVMGCMIFMSVNIASGVSIGMKTFAATVLGGIGEFKGAVLGGLVIGIVESMTAGYIGSEVRDMAAFVALIVILVIRPSGLLGKPLAKKV
jgi:branched-chain amino acid transport system permease protein